MDNIPGDQPACRDLFPFAIPDTRAFGARRCFSSSIAFSALRSWKKPTNALMMSIRKMIPKSSQCWMTAERIAAISIIQGIGPQKYPRNLRADAFFHRGYHYTRIPAGVPGPLTGKDRPGPVQSRIVLQQIGVNPVLPDLLPFLPCPVYFPFPS